MPSNRNFKQLLVAQMAAGKCLCVGLDIDFRRTSGKTQFEYAREIIDGTRGFAQSYKIQISYYEVVLPGSHDGVTGFEQICIIVDYINQVAPHIPVILDCKDGDIDRTNEPYIYRARELFGVDAQTVNPYMGLVDGMMPFVEEEDYGVIVICRTSNKGGSALQDLMCVTKINLENGRYYSGVPHASSECGGMGELVDGPIMPLYQFVAHWVTGSWNDHAADCGVVVGATMPEEMVRVRSIVGSMPILIPGVGKQAGDVMAMMQGAVTSEHDLIIVNSSSGIIYADDPVATALSTHDELSRSRELVLAA